MHKRFTAILRLAIFAVLISCFTLGSFAWAESTAAGNIAAENGIMFSAVCNNLNEVGAAAELSADFICFGKDIELEKVYSSLNANTAVIIDADSIEQADKKYNEILLLKKLDNTYFRISASRKAVAAWAKSKAEKPNLIVYYNGNVYFSAINCIKKSGDANIVQFQTGNPYGVVLHNSVMRFFQKDKYEVSGMFSTADSTKSAQRTDTQQGWDDLISRGYQIIETSYPADFAEYLEQLDAESAKLESSIYAAKAISTEGCPSNRVADYNKALKSAESLVSHGFASKTDSANARIKLDLAVKNISVSDGKHIKGDIAFTPARIIAAVLGVALVFAMQAWFRSRWNKPGKVKK